MSAGLEEDTEAPAAETAGPPEEEGLDGAPLSIPDYLIARPEVEADYPVDGLAFPTSSGLSSCEVVLVSESAGRLLVAVPHSVWARRVRDRRLPVTWLSKVSLLEVAVEDREHPIEAPALRVWAGLLDPSQEGNVSFEDATAQHGFGTDSLGAGLYPHGPSLAAACAEAFTFQSAESAGPEDALSSRVERLEGTLTKIAAGVKALVARDASRAPDCQISFWALRQEKRAQVGPPL